MKIIKKMRKAKGFTLVELLIVIIIIGILAGMMMLATGAATDKAEATKIVSNMRNIKAAAVMYYADKGSWTDKIGDVEDYLDQVPAGYSLSETSDDYFVEAVVSDDNVLKKLKEMDAAISADNSPVKMKIN